MATKRPRKRLDREALLPLILDRIAGGETLVSIADDLGVGRRTVYDWIEADESAQSARAYARVREAGADSLAARADAVMEAEPERIGSEEGSKIDLAWVQHTANRARHWIQRAAHFCPSKYGQKAQLEHSGPGGKPIESVSRVVLVDLVAENAATQHEKDG